MSSGQTAQEIKHLRYMLYLADHINPKRYTSNDR